MAGLPAAERVPCHLMRSAKTSRPAAVRLAAPLLGVLLALGAAGCGGSDEPKLAGDPTRTPVDAAGKDAPAASDVVEVVFENPGNAVDALREKTVRIDEPTNVLRMKVTELTYRGVVCGFTFRGGQPASPVTIRVEGRTPKGTFDSGAVPVSWTGADEASVDAGDASSNGWNFAAAATINRNGPGWVVQLGGVTQPGPDTIPTEVNCEIRSPKPVFTPAVGPVGYWAAFAGA